MFTNNYSEKADTYSKHRRDEGTPLLVYKEFEKIFNQYITSGGNSALDFGSGAGRSRKYLASLGFEADGVDINPAMIAKAQELDTENANKYQLIKNSAIPHENAKYDLVFSIFVVLELASKKAMSQYFAEAYRVMKADGAFVICTVTDDFYEHQWVSIDTNYPENKAPKNGDKVKIRIKEIDLELDDFYWTKEDYREIAAKNGFTILEEIEPRAPENERDRWISECDHAPYVIFVLKKTNSS